MIGPPREFVNTSRRVIGLPSGFTRHAAAIALVVSSRFAPPTPGLTGKLTTVVDEP
jgi:hypothetical protein